MLDLVISHMKTESRARPKVVLIEDNADNREVLEIVLQSTYETVVFDSAIEALLRIPQENPAIVLTDLILPDLDGWQFITNLRVKGVRAPVVAVSALVFQGMRQKVIAAGFDEFVTKPIDIDILLSTIHRLLKRESSA